LHNPLVLNDRDQYIELRTGVPYANLIAQQALFSQAVGDWFGIRPEHVIPLPGTTGAIEAVRNHILKTNLKNGRAKVLSVSPEYWRARESFQGLGFTITDLRTEPNGFAIDTEELARTIREEEPELVYLSLPNNPTGAVFDPEDLVNNISDKTAIMLDLTLPSRALDTIELTRKLCHDFYGRRNLFLAGSTSKSHNTAEYRIGWLVCVNAEDCQALRCENRNVVASRAVQQAIQQIGASPTAVDLIDASFALLKEGERPGKFHIVKPPRMVQSVYVLVRAKGNLRRILADNQIRVMWGSEFGLSDTYIRLEMLEPANIAAFIDVVNSA
jgi:aspartate/methionine/tyrosine aminotransferase